MVEFYVCENHGTCYVQVSKYLKTREEAEEFCKNYKGEYELIIAENDTSYCGMYNASRKKWGGIWS